VLLVHADPEALLGKAGVGDSMADGQGDAVLIMVVLHHLLLACDHRLLVPLRLVDHLEDVLVLQLDRGETQGDRSVQDVLGDVVHILPPKGLRVLLRSWPGGKVDLRDHDPCPHGLP